jgi:hypothetical protein
MVLSILSDTHSPLYPEVINAHDFTMTGPIFQSKTLLDLFTALAR